MDGLERQYPIESLLPDPADFCHPPDTQAAEIGVAADGGNAA